MKRKILFIAPDSDAREYARDDSSGVVSGEASDNPTANCGPGELSDQISDELLKLTAAFEVVRVKTQAEADDVLAKSNDIAFVLTSREVANQTALERKHLEELAITDPVTLLRNNRFFRQQLAIEVARSLRHQRDLSLLLLDVDRFKDVNDKYGHLIGDKVLRAIGARLTEAVRTLDTVVRYGGEEFAIILPDTSVERAALVAERVRAQFSENPFFISNQRSTLVTMSLGIASCPHHARTAEVLIESADKALYRAKDQGRNQFFVSDPDRP